METYFAVVTAGGNLLDGGRNYGSDKWQPLTEEEANSICKRANKDAEQLGVTADYSVVERDK